MFDFAKDMGLETLVAEPAEDAFDTLEQALQEYGIKVAIHYVPSPRTT